MNTSSFETPRPIPFHAVPSQPTNNNNSNNNQPVSTSGFAGKKSNKFFKQQQKQIHSLNFTTLFLMINQHKIIKKKFLDCGGASASVSTCAGAGASATPEKCF